MTHALAVVAFTVPTVLFDGSLFAWHPLGMTLGYLFFMASGVLSAIRFRSIPPSEERVEAITKHLLLQGCAILFVLGGFFAIYTNKNLHSKPHYTSLHGKLGVTTVFLSCVVALNGLGAFKKMGFLDKLPESWQPVVKMVHRRAGLYTWLLACFVIELGLATPATAKAGFVAVSFWQGATALGGAGVILAANGLFVEPEYSQLPQSAPPSSA